MRNWFTLAGVDSRDFGVYISGQGTFGAPAKAYELLSIPGRNGAIVGPEKRLENATVTYSCYIYSDFEKNIADFRTFLLSLDGYQVLTDSYHTDEFRLAVYQGPFDPEVTRKNDAGSFELVFSCKPQRYLYTGDVTYPFDVLDTSLYGTEIYVPEPSYVGTSRFSVDILPSAYPDFNEPDFAVGGTPTNPLSVPMYATGTLEILIDNESVFSTNSLPVLIISGTVDLYTGTVTNYCYGNAAPYRSWTYIGGNVFVGTPVEAISSIKYCNYYKPVASPAEFTTGGRIAISGGDLYVYDTRFSDIDSFLAWERNHRITVVGVLTTPQTGSITPFMPNYPATPFTIKATTGMSMMAKMLIPYAATDNMENPTRFPAKPLIRVYGTGTVNINDIVITVSDVTSYVDIDCELMDCYEGSTNRNDDVSFSTYDFPVLMPGVNPVSFVGPSSVEITPRWWRV